MKEEVIKCILGALLEAPWIKRSQSIEAENVYNTLLEAGYVVKKEEPKEPTQATSELLRDANEIIESGRKSICYCDEKFICKPCEWLTKYEEVK